MAPKLSKRKAKSMAFIDMDLDDAPSHKEKSLRAMMDIDDGMTVNPVSFQRLKISLDHVEKASRSRQPRKSLPSSDEENEDEDVMIIDEESDVPPEKPKRKKKEKKIIPVGKNGLKKKRVVKSRMTMDEKGYMGEPQL